MTIQKRSIIAGVVLAFVLFLYGAGRYYSPFLIQYVVEQSLIQKAPSGTTPVYIQKRLGALLSAAPNQKAKMQRLLRISEYLEKVQSLAPEDLDSLLAPDSE